MRDDKRPLSAAVSKYMIDRPGATPAEVIDVVDLNEQYREQVEHYLADTRYTLFKNCEDNDAHSLRYDTVEWSNATD